MEVNTRKQQMIVKNRTKVFAVLTLLWLGIIYSFSLQPGDISGDTSGGIVRIIVQMFASLFSFDVNEISPEVLDVLDMIIRKCAHFTEYMILGILALKTLIQTNIRYKGAWAIGFCMLAASIDETIQLFVVGREGRILDVLIDSSGAAVGVGLVILVIRMRNAKKA